MILQLVFFTILFLLVYTYLIYPLVAVVIGSGRPSHWNDELPKISILVPVHNEETVISAKIENFHLLDYPKDRIELVIFNDGSTDKTAAIIQDLTCERLRLFECTKRGGKAAAMNQLVQAAQHSLVLFSDANVTMAPDAVRRLVDHLIRDRVGAVTGEVRLVGSDLDFSVGEQFYYWLERRIQRAESRIGSVMGVDGAMYLLRRELYVPLPEDTILDDFLVSINVMRAQRRIVYDSTAKATESGTPSVRQEYSRRVRIAAGAIQLLKRRSLPRLSQWILWLQFLSHKLLRWFSPILLMILFATNATLLGGNRLFEVLFGIQLVLYGLLACVCLIRPFRKTSIGGVLFYFGLSQVAVMAGIIKGILNRQPTQWEKGNRAKTVTSQS